MPGGAATPIQAISSETGVQVPVAAHSAAHAVWGEAEDKQKREVSAMKWFGFLFMIILAGASTIQAQDTPSGKTLAATMAVYAFPKAAQAAAQQSQDEAECYEWATGNVGYDVFELRKQSLQQEEETEQAKAEAQQAGRGSGLRGALRGAAAGAVIGEIADDDAGKGAAIGAGAGALKGRRKARKGKEQAVQHAEQQGQARQQATQEQMENFKKAFSVCLEAKEYLVKY